MCFLSSFSGEIGGFLREESQDVIRDIDWSTRNVMLGYDVAGMKWGKWVLDEKCEIVRKILPFS